MPLNGCLPIPSEAQSLLIRVEFVGDLRVFDPRKNTFVRIAFDSSRFCIF